MGMPDHEGAKGFVDKRVNLLQGSLLNVTHFFKLDAEMLLGPRNFEGFPLISAVFGLVV